MATISTLAVNLIARTSVFERGMKRSRKSMHGFRKETTATTARLASFAKGLLISGGAVLAIKSFTKAASDAQETMNIFNTVFAENALATEKWANAFADNVGRARTAVKGWAASLQDTFVPLGLARNEAAELSKTLVELAVDVGSFKNVADDEVINSFTSAIVGNHRAVRAYGIVLTNATIEQEALDSGINKTFTDLTELEKVQLRYNLILKSTADAQGDAIRTAGTYANTTKRLEGNVQALKEAIGLGLLPAMNGLVKATNEATGAAIKFEAVGRTVAAITDVFKGLAGWIRIVIGVNQKWFDILLKVGGFAVKFLSNVFEDLFNRLAKTKLGNILGLEEIDLSPLRNFVSEIETTFSEAASKNIKAGTDLIKSAFKGESLEAYNNLIKGTQKALDGVAASAGSITATMKEIADTQKLIDDQTKKVTSSLRKQALVGDALLNQADQLRQNTKALESDALLKQLNQRKKALEGQLSILKEQKRVQDEIAKAAKTREIVAKKFASDIKAEGENIFNILKKELKPPEADLPIGKFQEVRTMFVDVAALTPTDSPTNELVKLNIKTDKSNQLLEELNRHSIGVHRT